jgi:hypothetical protein
MGKALAAKALFAKHVRRKDRIVLVNPPVEETRYSWLRWNQPLDLLKIASRLRSHFGCDVELLDCMKPDADGKVIDNWLPRDRRYHTVGDSRYPMHRFGLPYVEIANHLERAKTARTTPTQIWITSLCSYWYESVAEVCRVVRQALPDAQIVLLGQYARLMPKHAVEACVADFVVSTPADLGDELPAFDLYGTASPPFVAVELDPTTAVATIEKAVAREVYRVAFFAENICQSDGGPLREIVEKTHEFHRHLRYHVICGLHPADVTPVVAKTLAHPKIEELNFEEQSAADGSVDVEAYRKARCNLNEAGADKDSLSGFVWIGRPGDKLEQLVLNSFRVLDAVGGLILKPFTPTPGGPEALRHRDYLASVLHRNWSPHLFPFAELNEITRDEYHDLYRMAAFLNEKVRNVSFDFLKGTLGASMLRESLTRKAWNLGPSPLRVID